MVRTVHKRAFVAGILAAIAIAPPAMATPPWLDIQHSYVTDSTLTLWIANCDAIEYPGSVSVDLGLGAGKDWGLGASCAGWSPNRSHQLGLLRATPIVKDSTLQPGIRLSVVGHRHGRWVYPLQVWYLPKSGPMRRAVAWTVIATNTPDRQVWQGTDEFWNYCVNTGQRTYSRGGRLYCWRLGSRRVRVVQARVGW